MFDAPEATVRDRLDRGGYETIESAVAEERLRDVCGENGIYDCSLSDARMYLMRNT